jgi:integrase
VNAWSTISWRRSFEGLRAAMAKRWGPVRLGNAIQVTRSVFLYGYESGLLEKPMRFGAGFKKPSKRVLRVNQAKKGPRDFSPADLKAVLKASDARIKAMVHLGINAGFGCTDCAGLPLAALDLKNGWLEYHREKAGVDRRLDVAVRRLGNWSCRDYQRVRGKICKSEKA